MTRSPIGAALWLAFAAAGCDSGSSTRPDAPSNAAVTLCSDLAEIAFDGYVLQNNTWGKTGVTGYEQCVERSEGDPFPLGWRWTWPEGTSDQVRGYPFIGTGQDPWRAISTMSGLPRKIREVRALDVAYDLRSEATGKYNLAFDIWVTTNPGVTSPPELNVRREIMIWLDYSENPLPPFWSTGEVTIGGEVYEYFRGENEPTGSYVRDYLAFLKREPELRGTTNVQAFLTYLVDNGHILPDEYVRNVFLGNEVWYGTGSTYIDAYSVTLE